ncbi:Phosphatidylinositol 4-kinase gamma 1 [Bienertia sinuspersici]
MAVVVDQHHDFKPPARSQRCRLLSFTHLEFSTFEPSQTDVARSLGHADLTGTIHRSLSTPCLTLTTKVEEDFKESRKVELIAGKGASKVRALVVEIAIALASGVDPVPVSSGLGGAYLLHSRNGDPVALAKPMDEEPLALNNPKGFTGRMLGQPGLKRSVRVGETGIRELAAYLLDHGGFAGVPPTALVRFSHVKFNVNASSPITSSRYKIASLQRFVEHDSDAGDLSPSGFSTSSVHRIGIFDIRVLNIDRHSGNILVGKYECDRHSLGAAELIPIDHGLCLPEWLDDPYFEWLHWPQASIPFSDAEMEYISNLNPFEDAGILRTQLPRLSESSIRLLVVCTLFLKRAASSGFCLGDIGEMMTRDGHGGEETMSVLETICARAKYNAIALTDSMKVGEFGGNHHQREEDVLQIFEFDDECKGENSKSLFNQTKVVKTQLSSGKPPLAPQPFVTKQVMVKSNSFAAPGRMDEIEGISFGEMNEGEWEVFLEMFERLLPEVFEERKNTSITQRVGSA